MRISMTRCAARSVPAIVALFAAPASRDSRAIAVCTSLYFVEAGFPIPICMFRYIHHTEGETAGRHRGWQSLAHERAARDDASGPKKTELGLRPTLRFVHFISRGGVPRSPPPSGPLASCHTANWASRLRGCHVNCSQYRRWWSVCSSEMPRLTAASVLRKNILEKTWLGQLAGVRRG